MTKLRHLNKPIKQISLMELVCLLDQVQPEGVASLGCINKDKYRSVYRS